MLRYRNLVAWERARTLVIEAYAVTKRLPASERYGLTSQIRRAAVSVVANIAEGAARPGKGDFGRFLDIALGSLAELDALVDLTIALGFLRQETCERLFALRTHATKLTWALRMKPRN